MKSHFKIRLKILYLVIIGSIAFFNIDLMGDDVCWLQSKGEWIDFAWYEHSSYNAIDLEGFALEVWIEGNSSKFVCDY
jgi:hypothetical protein